MEVNNYYTERERGRERVRERDINKSNMKSEDEENTVKPKFSQWKMFTLVINL